MPGFILKAIFCKIGYLRLQLLVEYTFCHCCRTPPPFHNLRTLQGLKFNLLPSPCPSLFPFLWYVLLHQEHSPWSQSPATLRLPLAGGVAGSKDPSNAATSSNLVFLPCTAAPARRMSYSTYSLSLCCCLA